MPDIINSSFDPRLPFPLDVRQQVQDMNALYAIAATSRWEGMVVYVRGAEIPYILKGGVTNSFWVPFQFNSGGGLLPNGIVIYGESQQSGNDILLNDAWVWRIDQVDYQSSDDVITIAPAAAGNIRVDIIVGDNLSNFVLVTGTEVASPGPAIEPNIPPNTVPLLRVEVSDTGITAFEDFALSAFVRFDINNQGLIPSQRLNARTNIQAVSKDTDDTRIGTLANTGTVTVVGGIGSTTLSGPLISLLTGEDGTASSDMLRMFNTVGGGISVQKRGSTDIIGKGDSVSDYFILRLRGSDTLVRVEANNNGILANQRSAGETYLTRRDENYLTYPVSISGTGKLNDVALANGVGAIKFSSGVTEVSGIDPNGDGKELFIWSDNPDGITLPAQDTDSIAANRYLREVNVPYQTWVKTVYDPDLARWVNSNTGELQETDARYFEVTSDVLTLKYILPDIAALQAFVRGPAVLAYVSDSVRGGYFNYVEEADFVGSPDFGISFPAQDGGYWVRDNVTSIRYDWFGTVSDGINDDAVQIKKAHETANQLNLPVINQSGEYWLITPNDIPIQTNTNLGKSIFHIDESQNSYLEHRFIVKRSEEPTDVVLSAPDKASFLSKMKEGVIQISELTPYEGKFLIVEDFNSIKPRDGGSGNGEAKTEMFVVDKNGTIIGDILEEFSDYTDFKAYKIERNPLIIEGGNFVLSNEDNPSIASLYIRSGFLVERTRVVIRNQKVLINNNEEPISMSFWDLGFYYCTKTYDFLLENIIGPPRKIATPSSGTYFLGIRWAFNVRYNNIVSDADGEYIVSMGGNHVKNFIVDNCNLSRVDCHENAVNVTVNNCRLKVLSCVGGGLLHVKDTTVNNVRFIVFRQDYGATWDGDIVIENCTQVINLDLVSSIIWSFPSDTDFDYKRKMIFGRTVKIDGFNIRYTVTNTKKLEICQYPFVGSNSITGERFILPELFDCRNIKVYGREDGVTLFLIDNPTQFKTQSKSSYEEGAVKPNSYLYFKDIDANIGSTTNLSIYFGTPFSLVDEYSWIPNIDIDNCGYISLQYRDSISKSIIKNTRIASLRTQATKYRGSLVFDRCVIKPRGTIVISWDDDITFLNTKLDLPYVQDTDTEITAIADLSSRYGDLLSVNNYLGCNHINTSFTKKVIDFLTSFSVSIFPEYTDKMFSSNGLKTPYMILKSGDTASRPSTSIIDVGYSYLDTTLGYIIWWDGTNWIDSTGVTV